ncbi:MAG: Asp-tRNA(Asn)/Glu-tRNA(Gln) amidotransferase subunit GatB [Candidatus Saccharibacteria bacterium]|nr:Asp-tRNA(Asn)/Glu-tRNA(Gln) amidotransferase subunit GatB [Candidatus Saccharibacteria bacterium]
MKSKYTATIGIECHVQLHTMTKLFAAVANDAREAEPNTLVSHICFGMPGALPVLNEKVVEHAARLAFAFNVEPQRHSFFERKHYFYPDLPKGYQITQLDSPIIKGGEVRITVDGEQKTVRLNRVQIEEDAGKNTHPAGADYSLVDLNRAGTPLFEIVSEPDIHTPAEAKAYARELYLLVRYGGVSNADLYHGNMRFDVNVSVSDSDKLGTRSETKNLNSFRSVEKATEYEINRQIDLLEKGEKVMQETRGWDDTMQKTISQRSKEEAHDYRYFPDPDLPPIELSDLQIQDAEQSLPTMPGEWRERLAEAGVDSGQIETLLEAELEYELGYMQQVEKAAAEDAKPLANLLVNVEVPLRRDDSVTINLDNETVRKALYEATLRLINQNKISSTNAKALITTVLTSGAEPKDIAKYAEEQGLLQVSDEGEIEAIVENVIAQNQGAADDVRNGEAKAIGFLVGQVMKASKGKANPQLAKDTLRKKLEG